MKFCYLVSKLLKNHCVDTVKFKSRFSLILQDLSGKFGCPVLSSQETHMPSLVHSDRFS